MFTYVSNYMSGTRQDSGDIEIHLLDLDPVLMRLIGYCTYKTTMDGAGARRDYCILME